MSTSPAATPALTPDELLFERLADAIEAAPADTDRWIADYASDLPTALRDELRELLAVHARTGRFLAEPSAPLPSSSVNGELGSVSAVPAVSPSPEPQTLATVRGAAGEPEAEASSASLPGEPVDDLAAMEWELCGPHHEGAAARFRIVFRIAEGGYANVYRAEQQTPVRRNVAIKVLKWGMDSRRILARFEAERQTLARFSHENIARLYDAGVTPLRRPFFAMELVEGPPITEFARVRQLSIVERVGLLLPVCRGCQYAHSKGVIHRDMKPTNVLVGLSSGLPQPKVIDFGIAKAVEGRLSDIELTQEHAFGLGTPQYMSPEQATPGAEIDTRTDIYGLGVLLYELVTGAPPFDDSMFRDASAERRLQIVREEQPPRASRRLRDGGRLTADLPVGDRDLPRVARELDWVIGRAIAKEPERRYPTVDAFASDLSRFLANEPVVAHPPTLSYRTVKFVRRRRKSVAVVVVLVLAASVVATALLYAGQARQRARAAELDQQYHAMVNHAQSQIIAAREARAESLRALAAEQNRSLADFRTSWQQYLAFGEPSAAASPDSAVFPIVPTAGVPPADPSALTRLQELARRLDAGAIRIGATPEGELRLLAAESFVRFNRTDDALHFALSSVEKLRPNGRPADRSYLSALNLTAALELELGQWADAEQHAGDAVRAADLTSLALLAVANLQLAKSQVAQGRMDQAEAVMQRCLSLATQLDLASFVRRDYADWLQRFGHPVEAERYRKIPAAKLPPDAQR